MSMATYFQAGKGDRKRQVLPIHVRIEDGQMKRCNDGIDSMKSNGAPRR